MKYLNVIFGISQIPFPDLLDSTRGPLSIKLQVVYPHDCVSMAGHYRTLPRFEYHADGLVCRSDYW